MELMKSRISSQERKRRFKRKMFEANPYCPICNVLMVLPAEHMHKQPMNLCTLDHVFSRLEPERQELGPLQQTGIRKWQIMCFKCNLEKEKKESAKLSKEELWQRSGRSPQNMK